MINYMLNPILLRQMTINEAHCSLNLSRVNFIVTGVKINQNLTNSIFRYA